MKKTNPFIRLIKHMFSHPWQIRRRFSAESMRHIEKAIAASERKHAGEIRFVVEAGLHPYEILCKITPKKRAIALFGSLNIWDTEQNNGVLIYLLLADRDVEIVADRAIDKLVGHDGWELICRDMETSFRKAEFEAGVLQGIAEISVHLEKYFPQIGESKNEVSNKPIAI